MRPRYSCGNDVRLLRNGTEYFPALLQALDSAQYEIFIETYIYELDEVGQQVTAALLHAASRGVQVHLLLDGFGCRHFPENIREQLEQAGVQVLFYRPKISPWTFKRNRLRRLHRKLVTVDAQIAFVGGINIIDDMDVPGNMGPRIDYAVRVQGPLLPEIQLRIERLWQRIAWMHLQVRYASTVDGDIKPGIAGTVRAAFVIRDNVLHRRDIERMYLQAIGRAREDILIANAYFLPGRRFRRALIAAAQRGVRVRLLLQGRLEYVFMTATHAIYHQLLDGGIEIYEYRKSFMHSKVAVVDNKWATVGSSNIDPFSLLLAREANVAIMDNAFATTLKHDLERAIQEGAEQVRPQEWQRGHFIRRGFSWLVFGAVRFVLGLIGYGNQH
jgi:cardiolipin synthase A/B